jgi:UDP-N-acetylglucosamine 1-carboxyvinyltransferase
MHVPELNRMEAILMLEDPHAIMHGSSSRKLTRAQLMASDLKASAALYLVGLCAESETLIHRINHLDHGYENSEEKLRSLGVDIERVKEADLEPSELS